MVEFDEWRKCYDKRWTRDTLVPQAFSHPAKVSFGLAERIYEHAIEEGWIWGGGDVIVTEDILKEIILELDKLGIEHSYSGDMNDEKS